jgi:para-aminobenzoate synthetase / 4-amino-4-deoxychorismate lyase
MVVRCRFDDVPAGTAHEARGFRGVIEASQLSDVVPALEEVEAATGRGMYAVGFVAYEAAPAFGPALRVVEAARGSLPLVWFGLFDQLDEVAPLLDRPRPGPALFTGEWEWELDEQAFNGAVKVIHDEIAAGMTYQVNLTTRLRRGFTGSLGAAGLALYSQLLGAQGGAYSAYIETADWALACGSPELFFSLTGRRLTARPMKGTARRGRFPAEDAEQVAALATSPKERAENVMIVDLTRNDVGRLAVPGSVEVPELCVPERYRTVWQMTSSVTCELRPSVGLAAVMQAVFPAGSVTGAPKASTMSLLATLERSPRGPYCGAIGYVGGGRMRFAVGIRTAVLDARSSVAEFGVGSGITWYAAAAGEWAELAAKAGVLWSDRPPEELFETLRWDPVAGHVNLDRHVGRMVSSAHYHGWHCDEAALRSLLAGVRGDGGKPKPLRVRVALDAAGSLSASTAPFEQDGPGPVRLEIDDQPVDSGNPNLFHKTGDRAHFERRMARHPGADDVVLVNERGEVTETTRANLVVSLGGRWVTPALGCGLLPGVERQRLLDEGRLAEAVIHVPDLVATTGLAVISSLHGWRQAVLSTEPHDVHRESGGR